MALKEKLLANEEILFESEKHWMSPLRDSVIPVLLIIGGFLVGWISPDSADGLFSFIGDILGLIQIALIVVGLAMIAYNLVVWRTAGFAVSNLRVLREEGLLSRRSSATLLQSVTDVKTNVPILGSRLGYGDVLVVTQGGEKGIDRFSTITQPEAFRDHILGQKVAGSPPALAAQPMAAITPAAATPAATAAPPASEQRPPAIEPSAPATDDMTTLARLAELRDSGAISAEEYEAKKTEILSRI